MSEKVPKQKDIFANYDQNHPNDPGIKADPVVIQEGVWEQPQVSQTVSDSKPREQVEIDFSDQATADIAHEKTLQTLNVKALIQARDFDAAEYFLGRKLLPSEVEESYFDNPDLRSNPQAKLLSRLPAASFMQALAKMKAAGEKKDEKKDEPPGAAPALVPYSDEDEEEEEKQNAPVRPKRPQNVADDSSSVFSHEMAKRLGQIDDTHSLGTESFAEHMAERLGNLDEITPIPHASPVPPHEYDLNQYDPSYPNYSRADLDYFAKHIFGIDPKGSSRHEVQELLNKASMYQSSDPAYITLRDVQRKLTALKMKTVDGKDMLEAIYKKHPTIFAELPMFERTAATRDKMREIVNQKVAEHKVDEMVVQAAVTHRLPGDDEKEVLIGHGIGKAATVSQLPKKPRYRAPEFEYVKFGPNWLLNMSRLKNQDTLALVRAYNKGKIQDIPNKVVSAAMKFVLQTIARGEAAPMELLSSDETEYLNFILRRAGMRFEKKPPSKLIVPMTQKQIKERINVLMGELSHGNNNPAMVNELRSLAVRAMMRPEQLIILKDLIATYE